MDEDVFIHDVVFTVSWPVVLCVAAALVLLVLIVVLWSRRK